MCNSVNGPVNSIQDQVKARWTILSSLHDNMKELMKKHVASGAVGNR